MSGPEAFWHIDFTSPHQAYMYGIKKNVYSGTTTYQKVDIIDTYTFGRCLVLDGKIQSSQLDEYIYHEAMTHPAMALNPKAKNILIIGGGEGAMVRELLKYPGVREIVMVDLDEEVVNLCREYLSTWHRGSFESEKLQLLHQDARRYIEETEKKFDIIISDLTEPVDDGPSYLLFTEEFYKILNTRLNPGGIITVQAGSLNLAQIETHAAVRNTLKQVFSSVHSYQVYLPAFDALWGFILASQNDTVTNKEAPEIDRVMEPLKEYLHYYDGETHRGMFALPKHLRTALDKEKRIITDNSPLTIY